MFTHRQKEQRPGCPGGSLGQGLEDGIHLLRHGCQRKLKLVLCKDSGRRVRGNLASASAPGDTAGVQGAGHLERGESSWGMWEGQTAVGVFMVVMKRVLGKRTN